MKTYAGIGSRNIPLEVYETFKWLGRALGLIDYTLRSGAAPGADKAFEEGCDEVNGKKEIFLPWKGFDNHPSELYHIPDGAYEIAKTVYPFDNWKTMKRTSKQFMARDCQQIGGQNVDDFVDFVICWTRDGCETHADRTRTTGGTGQAISYANILGIPVYNLYNKDSERRLLQFLETQV